MAAFAITPRFRLGSVVATPAALNALARSGESADDFVMRHVSGDWGTVCPEDKKMNDLATSFEGDELRQQRVLSEYLTKKGERLWLITEWNRAVTTLLLPSDY